MGVDNVAIQNERVFDKIIKEILCEEGIKYKSYSHDWIYRLEKKDKVKYIFGYNFDINLSGVYQIANDKAATYEILASCDIPVVSHHFFMSPSLMSAYGNQSAFDAIMNKASLYDYKVVCKRNNNGTGGTDVYKSITKLELEKVLINLFSKTHAISLSPLIEFDNEYRSIVIGEEIKIVYSKNRQTVVGDGRHMLKDLICNKFSSEDVKKIFHGLDKENAQLLNEIIDEGEIIVLNWKHNLGLGAEPEILTSESKYEEIKNIVKKVAKELNIGFASIDVVEKDGILQVLEVNSGVMMEKFATIANNGYNIAKEIYREVIRKMME